MCSLDSIESSLNELSFLTNRIKKLKYRALTDVGTYISREKPCPTAGGRRERQKAS